MHFYGLIIGISLIIGIKYFSEHNQIIPKSKVTLFTAVMIIFSIVGARLYHIFDQWSYYSQHLSQIPQTWNGGLGIFGGIFGVLLFIVLFINHKSYLILLDSITPILPLCQAIGRLGNWVNQENPIWWLEAVFDLCLFFVIKKYSKNPTAKYFIGYGLIRFITDFFRTDVWTISSVKISQIIGSLFIITGLLILKHSQSKK